MFLNGIFFALLFRIYNVNNLYRKIKTVWLQRISLPRPIMFLSCKMISRNHQIAAIFYLMMAILRKIKTILYKILMNLHKMKTILHKIITQACKIALRWHKIKAIFHKIIVR